MKKKICLILSLIMLFTILSACGSDAPDDPTPPPSDPTPDSGSTQTDDPPPPDPGLSGEITFLTWETQEIDTLLVEMVALFNETYPNVTVNLEAYDGSADAYGIRVAANELPDISNITDTRLTRDHWPTFFIPLDDTAAASRLYSGTRNSILALDGRLYVIPRGLSIMPALWYNKAVFADYGLDVAPQTLSEFIEICQTLKDNGIQPINTAAGDGWTLGTWMLAAYQMDQHTVDMDNQMLNSEAPYAPGNGYYELLVLFKEFTDKGFWEVDPLAVGFEDSLVELGTGKSGMILMGSWLYSNMMGKDFDMDNDFGLMMLPFADPMRSWDILNNEELCMAIAKSSGNQEAALAFVEWYAQVYDPIFSKGSGMLSPFEGADGPVWGDFLNNYPNPEFVTRVPQNEDCIQVFSHSGIDFTKSLQDILLGKSIADVAAELNALWQNGLSSLG